MVVVRGTFARGVLITMTGNVLNMQQNVVTKNITTSTCDDAGEPRVGRHRAVHACALRFLLVHPKRIFETLEGQIAANFRTKTFLLFVLTNITGLFDGKVFHGCLD